MEYHKNLSLESLFYINDDGLVCCEEWKDIIGYNGLYQVSDLGRVKSFNKSEKILKNNINRKNYHYVILYQKKIRKTRTVHQLVAIAFLNHTPCGYESVVNHKNFIRTDNRAYNLEATTQRDNTNKKHIKSSSQYIGVYWNENSKKWVSQITINKKQIKLGSFKSEIEASEYYENALKSFKLGEEIKIKKPEFASKYKGVCWNKINKKWFAQITLNGKKKYLGYFTNEYDAYLACQKGLKQI